MENYHDSGHASLASINFHRYAKFVIKGTSNLINEIIHLTINNILSIDLDRISISKTQFEIILNLSSIYRIPFETERVIIQMKEIDMYKRALINLYVLEQEMHSLGFNVLKHCN